MEGEIEIQVGDRQQIFSAGAMSHIPANTIHRFQVLSRIARVLHIVSPASAAAFYQEVGKAIASFPPDPIVFQEIRWLNLSFTCSAIACSQFSM